MSTIDIIRSVQRKLRVTVDGNAGPQTWAAIYQSVFEGGGQRNLARLTNAPVDPSSEAVIATLLDPVKPYARSLVGDAGSIGITIRIISGFRTFEEQDDLYAKGRTTKGPKVTNARGGYSAHNFGISFDVGVFAGNRYLGKANGYKAVGALGLKAGLEWGGTWTSIVDQPHFALKPLWATEMSEREMMAELRARHGSGRDIYS